MNRAGGCEPGGAPARRFGQLHELRAGLPFRERLFVERTVAEKFTAQCVEKQKSANRPGNDPATDVGPLIRPQHVQRMIDLSTMRFAGASVLCGGSSARSLGNFSNPRSSLALIPP